MKPAGYLIGASTCAGPYKIDNCLIEERMVYTNKIPCGHMRAPGDPQGFFANESQMDIVARKLGMDPVDFKRKNMMKDGDSNADRRPYLAYPRQRSVGQGDRARRL